MRTSLILGSSTVLLGARGVLARDASPRLSPRDDTPTPISACSNEAPVYSVNSASYLLYEVSPGGDWDTGPGEIQMSFNVVNNINQVETFCTLSNFKSDGENWDDSGTTWYSCQDQTITGDANETYTVKTNTQFDWNLFNVTVNQTWACDGSPDAPMLPVVGNFSTPLAPSCTYYTTNFVNITECHAPTVSCNGTAEVAW